MTIGTLNRQGNWILRSFWMMREMVYYYRNLNNNWREYKTDQDANYFGILINHKTWQILTFAEGDETLVECLNQRQFLRELHAMDKFYLEGE